MLVGFNPYTPSNKSNRQSPNFKALQNGIIEPAEVANYTKAKLLPGIIKIGGGYKPTTQNISKNLQALEDAKNIAGRDKRIGNSIIALLDDAKEVLIEEAKKLEIIR